MTADKDRDANNKCQLQQCILQSAAICAHLRTKKLLTELADVPICEPVITSV
jgi:hypothetical protein